MLLLNKHFYKAKNLLVITLLIFVLVPTLALFAYNYANNIRFVNDRMEANTQVFVEQLGSSLDFNLEKLINFVTVSANSKNVLEALDGDKLSKSGFEQKRIFDGLSDFFSSLNNNQGHIIHNVLLIPENQSGFYFYSTYNTGKKEHFRDEQWYQDAVALKGRINWVGVVSTDSDNFDDKVLAISRAVIDRQTYQVVGVMYLEFDVSYFNFFTNKEVNSQNIAIIDRENQYIYQTTEFEKFLRSEGEGLTAGTLLEAGKSGGIGNVMVKSAEISSNGWKLICVASKASYQEEILRVGLLSGTLLLFCLGIYAVYLIILQKNFTKPLQSLVNLFNEIEESPTEVNLKAFSCYEMLKVSSGAITLVEKNKDTDQRLQESIKTQKMLNADMLRARINPHFLYNVLNTVKYRALTNEQQDIACILDSLIRLLKGSVSRTGDYCSLREELGMLEDYIRIQQKIYEWTILFQQDVQEEALRCRIPVMLLQPLVENAILHGFTACKGNNVVMVTAKTENKKSI